MLADIRSADLPVLADTVLVNRISVVGNSGSGKTTVARRLAAALAVPHLELDAVFHQPGWRELDTESFRARVADFTAQDGWVVDGNYSRVRDIIWERADTVIWLDPSRSRVMRQVIWRTLRRAVTRAELWNGNREPVGNFFRVRPEESIIAWAWSRHHVYRERYLREQSDPANTHLTFLRLRTRGEITALIEKAAAS
ncbi:MAG TPA: AAA family ATPase [Streptosporangiaceae bacterium]